MKTADMCIMCYIIISPYVGVDSGGDSDSNTVMLLSSLVWDAGAVRHMTVPDPDHTPVYSPVQSCWTLQYTQLEYHSQTGEMSH